MKLGSYINDVRRISYRAAAQELTARAGRKISHQVVGNWANGKARPQGQDEIALIFSWSEGHVTANDFYDLPELSSASATDGDDTGVHESAGTSAYGRAGQGTGDGFSRRQGDHHHDDVLSGQMSLLCAGASS